MSSLFDTINKRAAAIKQARWRSCIPLTAIQLTDYDMAGDDPQSDSLPDSFTIIALTDNPRPAKRSTRRSAHTYQHFRIVKRPTEVLAIAHANGALVLEHDIAPVECQRPESLRYCIRCKRSHPLAAFVRHKRYLNGLSYACKKSLEQHKQERWYYASLVDRVGG